ncbi:iron-containing alcohol dehydrogenase [uncultured Megasphaera sp.]|uniref:iron-containing alcohol dehydrogenase n=1 Tax=uncultured Megasphaera sp. TaxID=165188 RepID=UPI0025970D50|nr:iron-containing alcohol dehydrogenase [uncultured Megasphaera sp.]
MAISHESIYMPSFTIGTDAYDRIGEVTGFFGEQAVIIGGATALEKVHAYLLPALAQQDIRVLEVVPYGGEATMESVASLVTNPFIQAGQMIFGVGGGRALDTAKLAADKTHKPFFAFPTTPSTGAAATAVATLYQEDGTFGGYFPVRRPAVHTFLHTPILMTAPWEHFRAGLATALSHLWAAQSQQALRNEMLTSFLQYGEQALTDFKNHTLSAAVEKAFIQIIIQAGMPTVFGRTADGEAAAREFSAQDLYHVVAGVPSIRQTTCFGEALALGLLLLTVRRRQEDVYRQLYAFYKKIGLPCSLADMAAPEVWAREIAAASREENESAAAAFQQALAELADKSKEQP